MTDSACVLWGFMVRKVEELQEASGGLKRNGAMLNGSQIYGGFCGAV